ncbi:MAG: hypothetical protein JNM31_15725 [Flavobacteriales bacterium]|nr:hypothetical protein [Flavobacteriales bacterium]
MRSLLHNALLLLAAPALAQVQVDRPVIFSGPLDSLRQVEGLAYPATDDALLRSDAHASGALHWAQVGGTANALTLTLSPAPAAYGGHLRVRFLPLLANTGPVTLNVNGLGARPLRRMDLLPVGAGELAPGVAVEATYADSVFILRARQERACPPGYLPGNGSFCVMATEVNNQSWFQAAQYCADRGARLCTWDEYYYGCLQQQANLTGLFNNWEWLDDTADHTHTATQGGRWQCRSQRSIGATDAVLGTTRCCLRPR